jgi:hypothetical protein
MSGCITLNFCVLLTNCRSRVGESPIESSRVEWNGAENFHLQYPSKSNSTELD